MIDMGNQDDPVAHDYPGQHHHADESAHPYGLAHEIKSAYGPDGRDHDRHHGYKRL